MQNYDSIFPTSKYDPLMKPEQVPWLIEGLWQRGKINGVAGFEKSGKSRLLAWLLAGTAAGSVLGLKCETAPKILYLCGEETRETVNTRLARYAELQGVASAEFDIHFMEAAGMRLDVFAQREWMMNEILAKKYEMIVADPFRRLHGADENDSTQMAVILNEMRRWSNKYGITLVLVHHTPKLSIDSDMDRMATWFRGSSDVAAILDTAQYVDRRAKHLIEIRRQGRFAPLPPLKITDLGDKNGGFERAN